VPVIRYGLHTTVRAAFRFSAELPFRRNAWNTAYLEWGWDWIALPGFFWAYGRLWFPTSLYLPVHLAGGNLENYIINYLLHIIALNKIIKHQIVWM
jgi:hypothetical protein